MTFKEKHKSLVCFRTQWFAREQYCWNIIFIHFLSIYNSVYCCLISL